MRVAGSPPQVVGYRSRFNSTLYREMVLKDRCKLEVLKKLQTAFNDSSYIPYYQQEEIQSRYEALIKSIDKEHMLNNNNDSLLWGDLLANYLNMASGRRLRISLEPDNIINRKDLTDAMEGLKVLEDWLYYFGRDKLNLLIGFFQQV